MQLNHTIVHSSDKIRSSIFLTEILGLPDPITYGPFEVVSLDNDVSLDFYNVSKNFDAQHFAFLITEDEFDSVLGRIKAQGLTYWPGPGRGHAGEIAYYNGGRGVYFNDPDGHLLEIMTVPYGGA